MNKYWRSLLAVVLAFGLLVGLMACTAPAPVADVELQAIGRRPLTPYLSYCDLGGLQADKYVILVDLSDRVNYPHVLTNRIILKNLRTVGNLSSAVKWSYEVGVITAVGDTDIDVEWIHGSPIYRSMFFDERWQLPEHGLSLSVVGASLDRVATNSVSAIATITTSVYVSTCRVISGTLPGVGDLILFMDEISDTATFDFFIDVGYDTE